MRSKPGVNMHVFGDKLIIRFYGPVIVAVNSRAAADAVQSYLESVDTGSRPDSVQLALIKAHADKIARAAAPNPSRGVARKAVRA